MAKLLIVDDDRNIRETLATFFRTCGHQVRAVESGQEAFAAFTRENDFELILSDCRMDKMDGLELLRRAKLSAPKSPFILMTAYATIESAIEAMKAGALDYVIKPFSLEKIQDVVHRALEVRSLPSENRLYWPEPEDEPMLVSLNPAMRDLLDALHQAAVSNATILLLGETGTGKSVLARQIHRWSSRSEGPFVVVNCTNTSERLSESELFGHVRGAFTGALHDRRGRLEAADNGPSSLTNSPISALVCRQSSCVLPRSTASNESEVTKLYGWTPESLRRQIAISQLKSEPGGSGKVYFTGSTWLRWRYRRFENAWKTSCQSLNASLRPLMSATTGRCSVSLLRRHRRSCATHGPAIFANCATWSSEQQSPPPPIR